MGTGTHGAAEPPGPPGGAGTRRPWPLGRVGVAGASMRPTLEPGDWLLVRWTRHVGPGDVVVMRRPDRPDVVVVKRAVRRLERGWWVAGDNPGASDDSRTFGVVPAELVLGRVLARYWPPGRRRRSGHATRGGPTDDEREGRQDPG